MFACQASDISVTLGDMTSRWPSLAEVIGGNFRRIRITNGLSQNDLARYGRDVGLRWNAAKVGDFEAGRSAPAFATVLAVLWALQTAIEHRSAQRSGAGITEPLAITEVRIADLFQGSGLVAVNKSLDIPAGILRDVCSGEIPDPGRVHSRPAASPSAALVHAETLELQQQIRAVLQRSGLTEDRLAKRLEIEPARLAEVSFRLWQSTFGEERDRRADPDANRQKRGRITRILRGEIEEALKRGDN
jgi:transcriptional regulator with XRE-family HTH domain